MVGGKDGASASGAPPSAMPKGNRVLDAMGEAEAALIFPHLEPMPLHAGLNSLARRGARRGARWTATRPAGRCPG